MIFDTDVLIWALRGHTKAARILDEAEVVNLSIVSYMELLNGVRDKNELRMVEKFIRELGMKTLPVTEMIGHRACALVFESCLKHALGVADALIAATALEMGQTLCTGNVKHFRPLTGLDLRGFRP